MCSLNHEYNIIYTSAYDCWVSKYQRNWNSFCYSDVLTHQLVFHMKRNLYFFYTAMIRQWCLDNMEENNILTNLSVEQIMKHLPLKDFLGLRAICRSCRKAVSNMIENKRWCYLPKLLPTNQYWSAMITASNTTNHPSIQSHDQMENNSQIFQFVFQFFLSLISNMKYSFKLANMKYI